MIVRNIESGWEIIFQGAHALLAGQIATALQRLDQVPRWSETLAAIVDHDDLKESFGDNVYLTELGAPKDFTQFRFTARERFEESRRRIEAGFRKHRWIGLLAARHAEELYDRMPVSKRLADLLDQQRNLRSTILSELGESVAALEAAYAVMQWCDRTSLILCQQALPAMHRRLEITSLGDDQRYEIWEAEGHSIAVEPWLFREDQFQVDVEVRTIHQLKFRNDRQLERCLKNCAVEERRWLFRKPQSRLSRNG